MVLVVMDPSRVVGGLSVVVLLGVQSVVEVEAFTLERHLMGHEARVMIAFVVKRIYHDVLVWEIVHFGLRLLEVRREVVGSKVVSVVVIQHLVVYHRALTTCVLGRVVARTALVLIGTCELGSDLELPDALVWIAVNCFYRVQGVV